jgi:hypothetical protein
LDYGWVFLKILGFGWVWVFAAPVWVRFRFLFFKKPGFRLGFGFFQNLKKMEIFRQNYDERRKKSKKIIQFFKLIAMQWWEKPWFHQKSTKIFDGQPLQHKIVRLLNAGPRTDPTNLWQVGPKSVDDGF